MSYRFFAGLLAGALLYAQSAGAEKFSDLKLTFLSTSAPVEQEIESDVQTSFDLLEEGAIIAPQTVFSIASRPDASGSSGSVFMNSDLVLEIASLGGDISHAEILATCEALDLVSEEGLYPEKALCDGAVYSYSVDGHMIVLLKNQQVLREYELPPGNYLLNGVPVIFK